MAKREYLERELMRLRRNRQGALSENENPAHANWQIGADVPDVTGPFEAIDKTPGEGAKFRCVKCGQTADMGKATLVR
jgi:hypothetical protein